MNTYNLPCSFGLYLHSIYSSYVDGRMSLENDYDISRVDDERPCSEKCLCQSLQIRAR